MRLPISPFTFRRFAVALWVALLPAVSAAQSVDPMIEGAKLCTRHLPRYERQFGIPVHLLSAIASTESGRWHDGLRIALPWPWTINAEGKGYYFNSKQEAIAAAKRLRLQGVKSMDVGCMQVNLYHHPDAFSSLEQAFEPEYNVAYAASFLRNLFEEQRSWRTASASYHSRTPRFGAQYVSRVYDRWYTIIDRVRNARLEMAKSIGGAVSGGGLTAAEADSAREANAAARKVALVKGEAAKKPAQLAMNLPARPPATYAPVQAAAAHRENGILVIRPQEEIRPPVLAAAQSQPVKMAEALPAAAAAVPPARLVSVNQVVPPAPRLGPRFIFKD